MNRQIVIIGGGGHGREVLDAIRAMNTAASIEAVLPTKGHDAGSDAVAPSLDVLGFVADTWPDAPEIERLGVPMLGGRGVLASLACGFIVAIGDGDVRREMDEVSVSSGCQAVTVAHPQATIGSDVTIGEGSYLAVGSCVMTNAILGRHVHLNVNAVVSHDTVVGDFTTLSPGVLINGAASVGEGVFFGTGAIVLPGRVIGDGAVIGAGAVVTTDIPAGVTAVGVPARWGST